MKKLLSRALVPVIMAGAVITAVAPSSIAAEFVPCNGGPTQVCYTEESPTGVWFDIPNVTSAPGVNLGPVAGFLDVYRINTGGGGGVQIPCITTLVNGSEQDACARLGLQRISRQELYRQNVAADVPALTGVFASVYVCNARLTATVSNIGIDNVPILSACAENLPQWQT